VIVVEKTKDDIIHEQIETIQYDIADDRTRITELERKIEKLTEIIKNTNYVEGKQFCNEPMVSKSKRLHDEILNKRFLKSKDVMNLFGCKYYTQAYRIMENVVNNYSDVKIEKSLGKGCTVITLKN
jgi:hypothetical protein